MDQLKETFLFKPVQSDDYKNGFPIIMEFKKYKFAALTILTTGSLLLGGQKQSSMADNNETSSDGLTGITLEGKNNTQDLVSKLIENNPNINISEKEEVEVLSSDEKIEKLLSDSTEGSETKTLYGKITDYFDDNNTDKSIVENVKQKLAESRNLREFGDIMNLSSEISNIEDFINIILAVESLNKITSIIINKSAIQSLTDIINNSYRETLEGKIGAIITTLNTANSESLLDLLTEKSERYSLIYIMYKHGVKPCVKAINAFSSKEGDTNLIEISNEVNGELERLDDLDNESIIKILLEKRYSKYPQLYEIFLQSNGSEQSKFDNIEKLTNEVGIEGVNKLMSKYIVQEVQEKLDTKGLIREDLNNEEYEALLKKTEQELTNSNFDNVTNKLIALIDEPIEVNNK